MKGIVVYNHFLVTEKYMEVVDFLIESAKKRDVFLLKISNAELMLKDIKKYLDKEKISFSIFYDKDIRLAEILENYGVRVFNSSKAISICDDKTLTYISLMQKKIKMPKTIIVPKVYFPVEWTKEYDNIPLDYPIVVKEGFGSFGHQVYLANDKRELIEILHRISDKPALLQEFIKESKGRDIRLQVVGDKVVASMYRESIDDFRANVSNGAKAIAYTPNMKQIKMAVDVCKILGLDFAGIDILFGKNDEPIFCEANSNAHFINLYNCTGINVADYIIDYIKETMKNEKSMVNL